MGGSNGSTPNGLNGILNLDLNSIPVKLENGTVMAGSICNYCVFKEGFSARNINLMNSRFQYSGSAGAGQGPSLFAYKNNLTDYTNGGNYNSYPMSYGYGYVGMYYNNIANLHASNSDWSNTTTFGMQWYSQYQQGNNYFNLSKILWTFIDGTGYNSGLWDPVGFSAPSYSGFTEFEGLWIGAGTIDKLKELNIDAFDGAQGVWEYTNPRLTPYEEAHAVVWKVEVNGINSFDNYMQIFNNPVGIGSQEIKVYFNREMDTSVDPRISYGVTLPFTQKLITEQGTWSSDGKIYTVNHEISINAADGINRIRVTEAIELGDGWEIPKEDLRFNMLVQSAGSASTGWFATAGLGQVDLEWVAPSSDVLDDALGYNMYRYQLDVDGNESNVVKLNESLIIEDSDDSTTGVYFTDFDVEQEQTYFYKYKILRTNFEETDYSSVVSTAPLTSTLGDSNGDFTVNVMDLVQNVDYILGNNPSPFIFIAGDVNNDAAINVLDIVGTVDIILNPTAGRTVTNTQNSINYYSNNPVGDAIFNWEGNDLFVTSNYDVGGIQLAFNQNFEYTLSDNLPGVERLNYTQDDATVLMLYSFNNTVIANTKTKILTRANASQELDINQAVVGTTNGEKLNAVLNNGTLGTIDAPFQSNKLELLKLYPNPSDGIVNLQYYLPELMDGITVKVYDIQGRLVWAKNIENQVGKTDKQLQLDALKAGNYILLMSAHKDGGVKYLSHQMLILK